MYVPGCASVTHVHVRHAALENALVNRTLPYGSTSRHTEMPLLVQVCMSKKKRSPATAVNRYRSVSLAGLRLPLTGVPGVSGDA